jgi:hypothetical protein
VERNIVVPTANRYSLTGNTAIKLTQAKNFSNSPSGTTFWTFGLKGLLRTESVATFYLALSIAGGSKSGK